MEYFEVLIILITGFCAGFINVVAGGGSLISLPVLIFLGLPPAVANASNRVAVLSESFSGIFGYRSKGVSAYPYSFQLGISAIFGAVIGAKISVEINEELFNRIIAIIMIMVVLITVFGAFRTKKVLLEKNEIKHRIIGMITFFFIGIYGGFIQAGVGFLIIGALTAINNMNLVKANSAKVLIVFIYTLASLIVFILEDVVNWQYGLILAIGNSSGAWLSSRLSVEKGEKWVKLFLIATVSVLAVKLWFFSV